ncbi:hypothetical protein Tco_0244082 [Tanacetum coccineum]
MSDHEPEQNESSITLSPRSDPLHHEFAGEPLTLPARNDRKNMLSKAKREKTSKNRQEMKRQVIMRKDIKAGSA